jgi:transposase InsO family protein
MEAIPLAANATADCAPTLVFHWITGFGLPVMITSHQRQQFTSMLWAALSEMLNISHHQTSTYHPEANGAVESLHPPPQARFT